MVNWIPISFLIYDPLEIIVYENACYMLFKLILSFLTTDVLSVVKKIHNANIKEYLPTEHSHSHQEHDIYYKKIRNK